MKDQNHPVSAKQGAADELLSEVCEAIGLRTDGSAALRAERIAHRFRELKACIKAHEALAAKAPAAQADHRAIIANLASVVRGQNGNRHADINELLAQAESCLAASPASTPEAATEQPAAWLATDLDGRGDVGFTKEEAKRRAGEGCTEFFPLYDAAPTAGAAETESYKKQFDAHFGDGMFDACAAASLEPGAAETGEDARDAARYRWIRDQNTSLETQQRDHGIVNGPSCYQEVEGIRELKWGEELDTAIDAAMRATQQEGE